MSTAPTASHLAVRQRATALGIIAGAFLAMALNLAAFSPGSPATVPLTVDFGATPTGTTAVTP